VLRSRKEVKVRRSAWEDGLDPLLEQAVREWAAREWPFTSLDWADRS
jgi:hypothetical protein